MMIVAIAHDDDDDASVATTRIASSVGSVVGDPRNAFLKSMTIVVTDNTINQLGLDLVLKDVMPRPTRNRLAGTGTADGSGGTGADAMASPSSTPKF